MARNLLLLSTSTVHGTAYLEHARSEIRGLLLRVARVLFVPYALKDHAGYAKKARAAFDELGYALDSIHEAANPGAAVRAAEAIFVGGGNSFRLLRELQERGLMEAIRDRVASGMPYLGASAGSNLACPTIRTTNDMPIVEPRGFEALGLIGFQINPHYLDADQSSTHMGETREERLLQYLEENDRPVLGLREGAMLRVEGDLITLRGSRGARLFRRGLAPLEVAPGASVELPHS